MKQIVQNWCAEVVDGGQSSKVIEACSDDVPASTPTLKLVKAQSDGGDEMNAYMMHKQVHLFIVDIIQLRMGPPERECTSSACVQI